MNYANDSVQLLKAVQRTSRHPVLLIAAADSSEGLPPTIRRCFSHEVSMGPLTEEQRLEMISESLGSISELLPDVCECNVIFRALRLSYFCSFNS